MSINDIYNQKLLELISSNKCDLSNANLENLDENIFNYTNIEELILNDNLLTSLSVKIENLIKLKSLVLSDNLLEELPESICNMIWLEELYLSGNKLKKLPKNIIKLKNIKWLSIIDNDNLVLTKQQEKWIENIKSKGNKVL